MPRLFAFLSLFGYLFIPKSSASLFLSTSGMYMPELFLLSASGVPIPGFSIPLSSSNRLFVPGLSASPSLSVFYVCISKLFALSTSSVCILRSSAPSVSNVHIPGLFTLSTSSIYVLRSSTPSASSMYVLGLSTPSALGIAMPESFPPESFPPFLIWSSLQTSTPVLGKQRLGHWDQIIKKTSSEEALLTFVRLLPLIECPSPSFFSSNSIGKKRSFNKTFNLNCRPLADDYIGDEVDLSFQYCQCPSTVKANRPWR